MRVAKQEDLSDSELACLTSHKAFLREVEVTKLDKSFKLILLESLLENDGFKAPANTLAIAQNSFGIFKRRQRLLVDLPEKYQALETLDTKQLKTWHTYWLNNPVNAWTGGSRAQGGKKAADKAYFKIEEEKLTYLTAIAPEELDALVV